MQESSSKKGLLIAIVLIIIVAVGILIFSLNHKTSSESVPSNANTVGQSQTPSATNSSSVSNATTPAPAANPVVDPLQGVYKNPF